ncbi:uncharacterized protein jcadb [Denticeps clupeoides]|uniref:Uncharacterized protein n=1 Tax=Denticeps clupeoides TaxID=299321 RepID=A0AAY4AVQ1_9TELE|nr:uncharacterized protein LOC114788912 [Denticeps clupeoides]XP_028833695.1 uncharacterized protein LOC114788912 [Denticeps clupeoides]
MYSVEDLLISHGYKVSRNGPAPASASSSSLPLDKQHGDGRRDSAESRPGGRGTLNGFEAEGGADGRSDAQAGVVVHRPAAVKTHPGENIESGERNQRRKDGPTGYLSDLQPLGDSLATDSGFYDAPSLTYSEHADERDVSYWRRRGQDFSALLDYADPRELRLSGGFWRGPVLPVEELRSVERPLPRWEEGPWIRELADSGPETLRVTGERKCQSLGTDEWRPAVGLGRQLSDGEAEHWAHEQQNRFRPQECIAPPAVRVKSQSLPRVLSPEDPQYVEPPQTGPLALPVPPRLNGNVSYGRYHSEWASSGERWSSQGQSQGQSHGPVAVLPKPRFSRPVKPPSYETHQQNRGSWETLSSEPGSKPRERAVCYSQTVELFRDRTNCLSQSAEPIKDRPTCLSQSSEPLRDRSLCLSQSSEPLRDRSVCLSQSSEPLRDRSLCLSQSVELLRDRSICLSQSAEPLRERSLCLSQSAEPLRERSLCLSQSAEPLREWSLCLSQSAEPLRERSLCLSQSAEPLRERSLCLSQSAEPLRERSLCLSQSAEPLRERSLCLSQSAEPLRERSLCLSQSAEPLKERSICISQSADPLRDRSVSMSHSAEPLRDWSVVLSHSSEPLRDWSVGLSHSAEPLRDRSAGLSQSTEPLRDRSAGLSQSTEPLRERSCGLSHSAEPSRDWSVVLSHSVEPLRDRSLCFSDPLRDRSLCFSQNAELLRSDVQRPDLLLHDPYGPGLEPPGYIPPPSYRRVPPYRGADAAHIRWKREPVSAEMGRWFSRQTGILRREDRSTAIVRKPLHPGAIIPNRPGVVQFLPFDDPRIRHISGGPCGNSLTDADKIRQVSKELPTAAVLGQSTHDSALIPTQGPCPNTDTQKICEQDNTNRWHRVLVKGGENVASEQSCVKFQAGIPVRPTQQIKAERIAEQPKRTDKVVEQPKRTDRATEQPKQTDVSADQQTRTSKPPEKDSSESLHLVKKAEPTIEPDKPKSMKRKLNETIFCLVSVPLLTQSSDVTQDQNDSDEKHPETSPVRVPPPPPSTPSEKSNTLSSGPNQSLKSTSTTSTDLELQALTGSVSSSRAPRRGHHRRKDSHSRPIKPNPHEALRRYSGAWPGDQYRDQETQTSPGPSKSAPTSGPPNTEAQQPPAAAPAADVPAEGGVGAECSAPYGYPMKGQKSLKPSSNSAFSRTGTFSKSTGSGSHHKPPLHPPPHPPPPPPNQPPSQPPPPPPPHPPAQSPTSGEAAEPKPASEAFGQFLLKPVSRRPWDGIEELETINKELQDQAGKRPTVDQCIENLNEAYKDILELSTASNNLSNLPSLSNLPQGSTMQIPNRIKSKLSNEPLVKPGGSLRSGLASWSGSVLSLDPEYREVKSAFSRPSTGKSVSFSKQLREEICLGPTAPAETGFRDYRSVMSQISHRRSEHGRTVKLDLPLPKEPITKDSQSTQLVSVSSAAEVPWADRQPMQDASTLTSPPDYEHICQSLQMARESGAVSRGPAVKPKAGSTVGSETPQSAAAIGGTSREECCFCQMEAERQRQDSILAMREEKDSSFTKVTSQNNRFLSSKGVLCSLAPAKQQGDRDMTVSTESDSKVPSDWRTQLSFAEKHLETLLMGGKAEKDVDNELSGQSQTNAEEITENESVNDQTTRIDVSAEVLTTGEPGDMNEDERVADNAETETVTGSTLTEQITEGRDDSEEKQRSKGTKQQDQPKPRREHSLSRAAARNYPGLDPALLQEFPPDRLPLSVLAHSNRRLSLGPDWERRGFEDERWGHSVNGARERRSLDAERRGLCGERWGLDNEQQGQGPDSLKQVMNVEARDLGIEGPDHRQCMGEIGYQGNRQVVGEETDEKHNEGEGLNKESQRCCPSERTDILQESVPVSPGQKNVQMDGEIKDVHSVSSIRQLGLHSTDSWEKDEGATRTEERCVEEQSLSASLQIQTGTGDQRESYSIKPKISLDNQPCSSESLETSHTKED